jgi:protease-4
MIDDVHNQFIDAVKTGRGDRLKYDEDLFSGLFWSGAQAKELGLVDHFGGVGDVARDVLGQSRVVQYNPKPSILDKFARQLGTVISARLFESSWQLR